MPLALVSRRRLAALGAAALALAGPNLSRGAPAPIRASAPKFKEDEVLSTVIAGSWRPRTDVVRDAWRHPFESLTFWGLQPGMTVADLEPGGGYWTQILAPYAARTGGRYIAGVADLENPALSEGGRKGRLAFEAKFKDQSLYGVITFASFGRKSKRRRRRKRN